MAIVRHFVKPRYSNLPVLLEEKFEIKRAVNPARCTHKKTNKLPRLRHASQIIVVQQLAPSQKIQF